MFKRVLLATDGSPSAEEAAAYAGDLALKYGAQMLVVYAFPSVPRRLGDPYREQIVKSHIAEGEYVVNPVAERLRDGGVNVDVEVLEGPPADAIMRVADARDCDLIVMGGRGSVDWPA
jgi:nucleotide-binding universal stress UspA family protein